MIINVYLPTQIYDNQYLSIGVENKSFNPRLSELNDSL